MFARAFVLIPIVGVALVGSGCALDLEAQVISATGEFERQLTVAGPVDLDVRTGSGAIAIRTGEPGQVRVVGRVKAHRGFWNSRSAEERVRQIEATPPITQNGNSIRIGEFDDRDLSRNVSISYQIIVPPDTSVRSRTGSGSQDIASLGGRVEAQTGSGSIQLGRIVGAVSASTGSGSIAVQGAGGGLSARTGSGSIAADGVTGSVRAHTGSGRVSITGNPTADWAIQTGSGSIDLRLPADAAFELNARTGSGTIDTRHPIELRGSLSRRHLQGRIRGGGPRLDVSAGSGSIRLE